MRERFNKLRILIIIVLFSSLLVECQTKHKSLHGVYYGYYIPKNANNFITLVFDNKHPGQVAIRLQAGDMVINSVYPVRYTEHGVIIRPKVAPTQLMISQNDYILICKHCDGKKLPKSYHIGRDKGKPFEEDVAKIAFLEIAKKARVSGRYMSKG